MQRLAPSPEGLLVFGRRADEGVRGLEEEVLAVMTLVDAEEDRSQPFLGILPNRDRLAARRVDRQIRDALEVGRRRRIQLHDQVERDALIEGDGWLERTPGLREQIVQGKRQVVFEQDAQHSQGMPAQSERIAVALRELVRVQVRHAQAEVAALRLDLQRRPPAALPPPVEKVAADQERRDVVLPAGDLPVVESGRAVEDREPGVPHPGAGERKPLPQVRRPVDAPGGRRPGESEPHFGGAVGVDRVDGAVTSGKLTLLRKTS